VRNPVQPIAALEAGKAPPQAPEFEQAVLGAALMFKDARVNALAIVQPESFYVHAHRLIWEAVVGLDAKNEPVDILTVTQRMRQLGTLDVAGGPHYISKLTNNVAGSGHVEYHCRIILQQWARRELITIATGTCSMAYDDGSDVFDAIDQTEAKQLAMAQLITRRPAQSIGEVAREHVENLDKPVIPRHSTGIKALDEALAGGWGRGDLTIIAGRPAMGKTSAAFSMIYAACEAKHPTALFSLELGKEKTNARFVSMGTGIPIPVLLKGEFTPGQIKSIHEHLPKYSGMPLQVNFATGITLVEIRSEVARMVKHHGITAVYIDQLNWITPPKGEKDRVAALTRGLKMIANEFDIPVIVLHQLSRSVTGRPDKRPELTDLRDSGAAEQDAQVVIFVHRAEYYNILDDEYGSTVGRGDLIIAKNSNGPTTNVRVRFDAYCARFRDEATQADAFAGPTDEPMPF
jgi:replicative DNA helicase